MHLAAGLSVGLTGLAAGYAIGIVGDVVGRMSLSQFNDDTNLSRAFGHTCNNQGSLSVWSSYSFLEKFWDSTGKFWNLMPCHS